MTQARKPRREAGPSEAEIRDWLRKNPEFVVNLPEFLEGIAAPRRKLGGGVSDFQHVMIERLREELALARRSHDDLVATGRANLSSQSRIHECVLAMLAANSIEQLTQIVTTDFAVLLDVDIVALCVESGEGVPPPHARGFRVLPAGMIARLLEDRTVRLRGAAEGEVEIYGGGAPLVASDALARVPLAPAAATGLIAFGSRKAGRFQPGQAVELLSFLAQSLGRLLDLWLTPR